LESEITVKPPVVVLEPPDYLGSPWFMLSRGRLAINLTPVGIAAIPPEETAAPDEEELAPATEAGAEDSTHVDPPAAELDSAPPIAAANSAEQPPLNRWRLAR
jgi:hypothetical protein